MAEPVQHIGIRKFRDRETQYLAGADPVAITRHGRVIGFYPTPSFTPWSPRGMGAEGAGGRWRKMGCGGTDPGIGVLMRKTKHLLQRIFRRRATEISAVEDCWHSRLRRRRRVQA